MGSEAQPTWITAVVPWVAEAIFAGNVVLLEVVPLEDVGPIEDIGLIESLDVERINLAAF